MEIIAYLAPLIPIAGVALLAFFIIGIGADQKTGGRHGLLQAFLMSVSLVMLGAAVGSLVFLGHLGLRVALPQADQQRSYDFPPALYLSGKEAGPLMTALSCTDTCELSGVQKTEFANWKQAYQEWRARTAQPTTRHARDLVNGLSVFLIAAPLFSLFFRWVQRDARAGKAIGSMRSFYFYGYALVGLLAAIVSGILLVNVGLRAAFLPAENGSALTAAVPRPLAGPYDATVGQTISNCASRCGFTSDDVALVQAWRTAPQQPPAAFDRRQADLATNLPIFLAGLPVFLYHFVSIRRETKRPTLPPAVAPRA